MVGGVMAVESMRPQPAGVVLRFARWVVDACPHVTDPEARLHVRIVIVLMLTVLPLVMLIEMLPSLSQPAVDLRQDMNVLIPLMTLGIWALVYVLARRGYYQLAAWGIALTASGAIFLAVLLPYYIEPTYDVQQRFNDLDYLVLALLLASTLLSLRAVRFLAILNVVMILALLLFIPFVSLADILRPLSFMAGATVMILLLTRHRNRLEHYRTAQLVEANQRLMREVQERQEAEQALLNEQVRYRGLFDHTSDAVFLASLDGRIEMVNEHALTLINRPLTALVGHHYEEFFPSNQWLVLDAQKRMLLEDATLPVFEERLTRSDGTQCPVEMHLSLVRESSGLASHFQAIVRDLSIRQQVEAQRLALNTERQRIELLRDFVSKMSHDLRTPLATIKTGLYLARRSSDQPERIHDHLNHIETQVDHLTQILENMLLLTRLDDPNIQLGTLVDVSINALYRSLRNVYAPRLQALGLDVEITITPDLAAYGDAGYVKEAVRQLFANAIAAAGQGGRIALRGFLQGGEVILEVADSGPGIPPEDLPHVFERFYRGDVSRSMATGGAGLGLAIARRIMELHGGRIEVAAEAVGSAASGVTFRLVLPARPRGARKASDPV